MNGDTTDLFEPQFNDDGTEEYACDMCPKRFPQLMALRVHRGWHYRSPDGRQITEPGQTWQPGSLRSQRGSKGAVNRNSSGGAVNLAAVAAINSAVEKEAVNNNNNNHQLSNNNNNNSHLAVNPRMPKCQFCGSTFASANNLRRHIVEVHKRNDWRASSNHNNNRGGGGGVAKVGGGFVDKDRECRRCNKSFETRAEWVEHKMGHARVMRPSTTFEWNCEMCGKSFTRKERLLQHMTSHAVEEGAAGGAGGGSGMMMMNNSGDNSRETMEDDDEDLDEDDEEGEAMIVNPDVEMLGDDDDDDDEEEEEEEGEVAPKVLEEKKKKSSLCCDLCQVSFTDEKELRRHVMSHFVNGSGEGEKKAAPPPPPKAEEKKEKEKEKEAVEEDQQPKAKKAKIDIPKELEEEDEEDRQFDEEDEEGEYVEKRASGAFLEDATPPRPAVNGQGEEDEDLDEGEYIEEYIDEDSFVSPKKTPVAADKGTETAASVSLVKAHQSQQQQCRLCSTGYENSFKILKCMESHRQRSKYQCQECLLFFATPKQLVGHQQLNHGGAGGAQGVVA